MKKYILSIFLCLLCFIGSCGINEGNEYSAPNVECGNSQFDQYLFFLQNKRIALVVNQSSLVDGVHLCDTLISLGINIKKIFAPEHGFRGNADAGEIIKDGRDTKTGLPIISLYGKNKKPTKEQLSDVDVVLYDLQDVGVRFYTYISTMHYVMEACAESKVDVLILDRPNPNGDYIDGPILEADCKSFVGMHPIPIVYGMTCGELAYMINGEGWLAGGVTCNLKVIPMQHYNRRNKYKLDVAPSPNLRDDRAIRLYPSLCFFEGAKVSVGRGTDKPFMVYGSPYIKSAKYTFTPQATDGAKNPLFKGVECRGRDLTNELDKERINLEYLIEAYNEIGDSLFWENARFFDLLAGTKQLRLQLKQSFTEEQIKETWQKGLQDFKTKREKYLIYDKHQDIEFRPIVWSEATVSAWVDTTLNQMTLDEKIAQLIWVTINNASNGREIESTRQLIEKFGVGGVLILKGTPRQASDVTELLQSSSKIPLLFSADAENGLSMKFEKIVDFPKNITLGAVTDSQLAELMGKKIGEQMRECGIHVNFAPVVDVNTNPSNPIIGVRSFGENPHRVSQISKAYVKGLQSTGCIAVVKHFPGHGDTSQDSHTSLPIVSASKARLDSVELLPFIECIKSGAMGVMSAHLKVPTLDKDVASISMSKKVLKDLLRDEMGFEGLIVSDAVNMEGIKIAAKQENVEAACLMGGNDVVEFSLNVEQAIKSIKNKITIREMAESEIDEKVRRVLAIKEWSKLYDVKERKLDANVNGLDKEAVSDMIFKESITILENNHIDNQNIEVKTFGNWEAFEIEQYSKTKDAIKWILVDDNSIAEYNAYISTLPKQTKVVVMYLGNPYRIKRITQREGDGLVVMYESTKRAKRIAAMYVKQRFKANGLLPVSVGKYKEGKIYK